MSYTKLRKAFFHAWKYHRASSSIYLLGAACMIFLIWLGYTVIKLKVSLPGYMQTAFIMFLFGIFLFLMLARNADDIERAEEKKEVDQHGL